MSYHAGQDNGLGPPYRSLKAVSPSNTVDLPDGVCSALYCSGAGNISLDTENGETVLIAVTAGWANLTQILCRRVRALNTTATGIIACY
jgi:hypothetical protein